jgi:hypothetical protein
MIRRATTRLKEKRKHLVYRVRETQKGQALLQATEFMRAPGDLRERQSAAQEYVARVKPPLMDPLKGYGFTTVEQFENFDAVLATSRAIFKKKLVELEDEQTAVSTLSEDEQKRSKNRKDTFLRNLLTDDDLQEHPNLVDFALSDSVLGMATRYLGAVPHLSRVDLVYSLPSGETDNIASQLFHVDPEGLTQVKFFIHIYDVGDADGPFTFIAADDTARILAAVRGLRRQQGKPHSGRYLDEEIEAVGGTGSIVRLKGPTGGGIAIDTSRCLHMGSRVQPGASRLCLYLQYNTTLEQTNLFDVDRYRQDPVRHLAVKHCTAPNARRIGPAPQMA